MNHLINFFESLTFDRIASNLEFSTKDEQLTIRKGNEAYLFYFSKVPSMFRTNLCQEILLISEDNAHLKLEFNNSLGEYIELKLFEKSVEKLMNSEELKFPENFMVEFEDKLASHPGLNYIYLTLKIKDKSPEQKQIKKSKI
jgi:hypothetical protein